MILPFLRAAANEVGGVEAALGAPVTSGHDQASPMGRPVHPGLKRSEHPCSGNLAATALQLFDDKLDEEADAVFPASREDPARLLFLPFT